MSQKNAKELSIINPVLLALILMLSQPLNGFVNKDHIQSQMLSLQDNVTKLIQVWEGATIDHRHQVTKDLDQNLSHITDQLGQLRQTMAGPHTQNFDPSVREDLRKAMENSQKLRQKLQGLTQVEASKWPVEQQDVKNHLEELQQLVTESYQKFREPFQKNSKG